MTDIVERLRAGICDDPCRVKDIPSGCACAEAAARIERLEAALRDIADHTTNPEGSGPPTAWSGIWSERPAPHSERGTAMPDIVERLRELSRQMIRLDIDMSLPAGSVDPAEAADTITTLRSEVERLGRDYETAREAHDRRVNELNAHSVELAALRAEVEKLTAVALAAEKESTYEHFEAHIDRMGDENATLRAEVERLKSDRWLGQHGLIPSDYAHAMDCLRAEVERLKAVLEQIIKFADEWEPETQDDYTGLGRMDAAQIARAALGGHDE